MDLLPRHAGRRGALALAIVLGFAAASQAAPPSAPGAGAPDAAQRSELADEAPFLAENDAAMTKMMDGMAVKPTGDVDRDFVAMMAPHHQGAIDMAVAVLRYGHNEQLRRLAQEIIVTQQQEIAAMRLAVGEALPPSAASPTQMPTGSPPAARHSATMMPARPGAPHEAGTMPSGMTMTGMKMTGMKMN
jgi:hypothetical protein